MFQNLPLWPERASSMAGNVDALFIFLLMLCGFMCLAIFTMIVVFAIRYRRRAGQMAEQIEGSNALEFTWTFIPFGIFLVIFVWARSEEHTSELQSRFDLVCRLLLEKK